MARVVTLAQLALLPIGTRVGHLKSEIGRLVNFDCQGVVQVDPVHRIVSIGEMWITLKPVLPDILFQKGRVIEWFSETTLSRGSEHPHRFVVYE